MTDLLISSDVVPNEAGYTYASKIMAAFHRGDIVKAWGLGPRIVSGQLSNALGGGIWKGFERMPDITPEWIDTMEAYGVRHPSSLGDCYHQLAPQLPRLKYTYNGMFAWWPGGPWEQALQKGVHQGQWYRYDLVSAYRWAATLGLPDTTTFSACVHQKPDSVDGLWIVRLTYPRPDLPITFQRNGPIVVSSEDIRGYRLRGIEVLRGVQWTRTLPSDYVENTLARLPNPKEAGRAYWGRWITRDKLRCFTKNRQWDLPNRVANFIWGWLVVARVRLRVWQAALGAAHVYVDEVVVPYELETGTSLGSWHLKELYPHGIIVKRTGEYGGIDRQRSMITGVKQCPSTQPAPAGSVVPSV